ncbi:uncharacterized protein LOC101237290 isoform X1 [Hydra vulgaris]|uniref:Uncharacterized protein LOC101237290 isoform X1 n=1 Tax=Hydra vulgaris TaxID=6087 RepID=A0ABM4D9E2_HYDVU
MISMIVLSSILCGCSVVLNFIVILTVSKKRSKDLRHLILMSLALCEGMSITVWYLNYVYSYFHKHEPLTKKLCEISGFIVLYLTITSVSHLVWLCIYRFITISHPLKIHYFFIDSKRRVFYFILPCWIYGLFWSSAPLFGWSKLEEENSSYYRCTVIYHPDEFLKRSYLFALIVFFYFMPLSTISFFTLKVHLELRNMLKQCKKVSGNNALITKDTYKLARQDFINACLIVASFTVVWSPYALCVFALSLGYKKLKGFLFFCALFSKLSTICDPIIYCLVYKNFRETLRRDIKKIFKVAAVAPQ